MQNFKGVKYVQHLADNFNRNPIFHPANGKRLPGTMKRFSPPQKKIPEVLFRDFVVAPGVEPGTHGFSVRCSTN
jgi:hypothetical protein